MCSLYPGLEGDQTKEQQTKVLYRFCRYTSDTRHRYTSDSNTVSHKYGITQTRYHTNTVSHNYGITQIRYYTQMLSQKYGIRFKYTRFILCIRGFLLKQPFVLVPFWDLVWLLVIINCQFSVFRRFPE